jgi:Haem-binding domain
MFGGRLPRFKTMALWGLAGLFVVALTIQAIPYGHDHSNPPVRQEPAWASQEVRSLAVSACFDCHSNQTHWPWYSNVAPVSWLIQRDVNEARERLNFSEWDRPQEGAEEAAEVVDEGDMPPSQYTLLHPGARLSSTERETLAQGFQTMFGTGTGGGD